jgi:LAS superfamily LD-carboxypeptidase LdcB
MRNETKFLVAAVFVGVVLLMAPRAMKAQEVSPTVLYPESLQVLITKKIGIANFVPTDLVSLKDLGFDGLIRQSAYLPLSNMMTAMKDAGIPVKITSAYRSFAEQEKLFNEAVASNPKNATVVAAPGHSEHQTALAVDFTAVLSGANPGFANTAQSKWLQTHAYKYGFILSYPSGGESITGYAYEPWHWRYVGTDVALQWKNANVVASTFLGSMPQWYIPATLVGQVVKSPDNATVYAVNANQTKRGFIAPEAFLSYGFKWSDILLVPSEQLATMPETIMVKLQGDPTVYQFNKDKTRQAIASAEAFFRLGFTFSDIVEINQIELNGYKVGAIIQ